MKRRSLVALALTASLPLEAAAAPEAPREPEPRAFAELSVLHATHGKREIDPRLGDLDELKKPPFSTYERYMLIDQAKLALAPGLKKTRKLPNGRVFRTELLGMSGPEHVRLLASINQPGGADFLPLLEVTARMDQRFIVAGQRHRNGILVLVITVRRPLAP